MFSAARTSLRRIARPQRAAASGLRVQRAYLSTGTRLPRPSTWVPVVVGTVTLSAALLLNNAVRLDSAEEKKPKSKPKAKQAKQSPEAEAEPKPEELLQGKEDEARAEGTEAEENGDEGASGAGGAFNPETGEINWDCPCLGGMAHGPCGPEFREAFSCFVYSEDEPKGINCVEKFKGMQDCFRRHPEVYGEEIMSDDDDDGDESSSPSGTDSPGIQGEPVTGDDPVALPPSGAVSPSS